MWIYTSTPHTPSWCSAYLVKHRDKFTFTLQYLPRLYKITVIHALQPHDAAIKVCFCSWFLQSVVEGEIDPQLTFSSDETWFHLQGYINTQNNRYWNSQNPHLTHEVPLHPVRVGDWCAVSAGRIVVPVLKY
jgi:hypothetical protein